MTAHLPGCGLAPRQKKPHRVGGVKNAFQRRRSQSTTKLLQASFGIRLVVRRSPKEIHPWIGNADLIPCSGRRGVIFSHPLAAASRSLSSLMQSGCQLPIYFYICKKYIELARNNEQGSTSNAQRIDWNPPTGVELLSDIDGIPPRLASVQRIQVSGVVWQGMAFATFQALDHPGFRQQLIKAGCF